MPRPKEWYCAVCGDNDAENGVHRSGLIFNPAVQTCLFDKTWTASGTTKGRNQRRVLHDIKGSEGAPLRTADTKLKEEPSADKRVAPIELQREHEAREDTALQPSNGACLSQLEALCESSRRQGGVFACARCTGASAAPLHAASCSSTALEDYCADRSVPCPILSSLCGDAREQGLFQCGVCVGVARGQGKLSNNNDCSPAVEEAFCRTPAKTGVK